jgi:gliding motility-associated-like protein
VILTVTDAAGNQSTCTSVVTVNYDRPPNPAVSPATGAICNGENTYLLLTNVIPTSWTWTVIAPPQITGWSDDLSGTKSSIQQPLINSGLIAYRAVYTILPRLYNTCYLAPVTADVWVEPTPQVTITSSIPTICNGSNIDVVINSPTVTTIPANLSYVIAVTSNNPGSLGGSASTGSTVFKADLPLRITGTLTNSSDAPIDVTYTVTPKLNSCSDGSPKSVKVTVNPTPRVIPVNSNSKRDSSICYGGSTQIILTSPTVLTSGTILFDYTISVTGGVGVVIGNTAPEVNRPQNYFISFPYQNTSDTIQSVYYSVTPKVDNAICVQGNIVVSEVKLHPQTIRYNYPGSDGSGILITRPLTCETSSVLAALKVNISKGANPYQINWTGPNGYVNNYDSTEIKNLNQGQYTVRVTDNLGCFNESSKTIVNFTARPQIIANIKYPNIHVSCPGGSDGSLRVSVLSGITQPYIYWVIFNDVDTLFTGVFPNSIDRDPGAYYDYSGLRAGFYKIVIKDVNGCEVARTTELKEPAPIIVGFQKSNYNGFNVSCIGYSNGSALALPTGGNGPYSYLWYPESGVLTVSTTTNLLDSVPAGKYYLETTDQLGCIKTDSVTLTEPFGMQLTNSEVSHSPDGNTNISCNGGNDGFIKLTISGGSGTYFYSWTGPNAFTANTRDINGLRAGVYTCSVTDNNGCMLISSLSFTLTEPPALSIAGTTSTSNDGSYNINCYGGTGSINITATGGSIGEYIFNWSTTNGSGIVNGQKDQTSLSAGTYHLVVTDSNGCPAMKDFTLTQPTALSTVLIPTDITCESPVFNNGSINLSVSSGIAPYTYAWSNGATTKDITGLTQGYYIVTVTDANGCTRTDSVRVNLPPPLTYTKTISDYNGYGISCNGLANGSIRINLTSGLAPFLFTWTGPNGFIATTKDISDLKAGQYNLLISDKNFCTATEIISITEPGKFGMTINLSESIAGGFNINCAGGNTGSISIEPHNQVNNVNFLWADGIFGRTRINLTAGGYSVIILDANNCHSDTVISLTEPVPMTMGLVVTQPFCSDKPDGEIKLNVTGGVRGSDYSYRWSDNSTNPDLLNIPAGLYKVTVTDLNHCSVKDSVKIEPLNEICLLIPNAISPNEDLINDVWNIGLIELYPEAEIKIFNRWGQLVWRSEKGYPRPWDGTSKGTALPMDSYHYVINLHNRSKPIIGNVTIMK